MAVAALSTSAIALTVGAGPQASGPASAEAPVMFAQLVAEAKSGDKGAQQGAGAETGADGDTEATSAALDEMLASAPVDDTKDVSAEQPINLLAEIEAMVAAAAQVTVTQPVAVPAAIVAQPAAPAADASVVAAPAGRTAAVIVNIPAPVAQAVAQPANPADTAAPVPQAQADGQAAAPAATPTPPTAAAPSTDSASAAPKSIPSDIATLLASLKAAFAPVAQPHEAEAAAAAPVPVAPAMIADAPAPAAVATPTPVAQPVPSAPADAVAAAVTVDTVIATVAAPDAKSPAVKAATVATPADAKQPAAPATPAAAATADAAALPQDDAVRAAADTADSAAPALAAAPAPAAAVVPQAISQPAQPSESIDATAVADPAAALGQPDQVVARHLDLARDNQWLDQLARDISQAATQQGQLKFHLNPEHLGALTVEIANTASGTAIRMTAETDQSRQIIADAQPRLLAEVRAQGLRVSESHVDLNNQNSNGGYGSSSAHGQQGQPGHQRQSSSAENQPFGRTPSSIRDDAGDSAARDDSDLYA